MIFFDTKQLNNFVITSLAFVPNRKKCMQTKLFEFRDNKNLINRKPKIDKDNLNLCKLQNIVGITLRVNQKPDG